MKKEHLKTVRVRNPALLVTIITFPQSETEYFHWLQHYIFYELKEERSNESFFLLQRKECQARERDLKYQAIMRNLVRRYVTQEQRKAENEGVTEDDVNEIKNDISAFRFEMIEIMRASGMNTQSASGPSGKDLNHFENYILFTCFNLSLHQPPDTGPPIVDKLDGCCLSMNKFDLELW